jgi:hypothetical protein
MTGRDPPRDGPSVDRDHGGRGLKDADRTAGSTCEHYGWRDVYAALDAAGGSEHE